MKMVGQISIFDLMASDIGEWERFRDKYCNKQMATLKFNEMGEQNKDGKKQKACCFPVILTDRLRREMTFMSRL